MVSLVFLYIASKLILFIFNISILVFCSFQSIFDFWCFSFALSRLLRDDTYAGVGVWIKLKSRPTIFTATFFRFSRSMKHPVYIYFERRSSWIWIQPRIAFNPHCFWETSFKFNLSVLNVKHLYFKQDICSFHDYCHFWPAVFSVILTFSMGKETHTVVGIQSQILLTNLKLDDILINNMRKASSILFSYFMIVLMTELHDFALYLSCCRSNEFAWVLPSSCSLEKSCASCHASPLQKIKTVPTITTQIYHTVSAVKFWHRNFRKLSFSMTVKL